MDKEKDEISKKDLKESENTKDEIIQEENFDEILQEEQEKIEEISDKDKQKFTTKKRNLILGGCIGLVVIGIFIFSITSKYKYIVYPKSTLYGSDISKLNSKELSSVVYDKKVELEDSLIMIQAKNKSYELKIKDYVSSYAQEDVIKEAMSYGKDKNIFSQFGIITMGTSKEYNFKMDIKEDELNQLVEDIYNENSEKAIEPSVSINGNEINVIEGKSGNVVDKKKLKEEIENSIINFEDNNNIQVTYIEEKPKILANDLNQVDTKISSYSTQYGTGGGRGKNVELATSKIDNLLLMPGDEFSYENLVGPVTQANGYTYAPVISNGELVQGIGGGVCQVSSTIYNAQLKAGILPTERRNHSKAVNYVPRGLDATLASGSIDYKFKNTYKYPLVINTYTSGGRVVIEFWSNKNATEGIRYEPVSYVSGKRANTYLYGYDSNNKRVYEKHIDTSIYK